MTHVYDRHGNTYSIRYDPDAPVLRVAPVIDAADVAPSAWHDRTIFCAWLEGAMSRPSDANPWAGKEINRALADAWGHGRASTTPG